jgi:ADP-heptose:LPS heptosyltransferase
MSEGVGCREAGNGDRAERRSQDQRCGEYGARLLSQLSPRPERVAVLRASRIGDFLCATPAFRALRSALPAAEITLIALPFAKDLVERSPYLDRHEPFPGYPGIAEQFFDARRTSQFLRRMQERRFDLAIQLHGSGVYSNPFALLLGARATAGFIREGDAAGRLDAALPFPAAGHEIQRSLALTTFLGAPPQGEALSFPLTRSDHDAAADLLAGAEPPLIGVHAAVSDAAKRWPPERFAAAARALRARHGGTVVVLSGPGERPLSSLVARLTGAPCYDLSGKTSLPVLGAVISRLSLLLSNDSGPAHIAYALGTPSVTIFGATDPARWGPSGGPHAVLSRPVPCRPCASTDCPIGTPCLIGLDVGAVVEAAERVMP